MSRTAIRRPGGTHISLIIGPAAFWDLTRSVLAVARDRVREASDRE